MKLDHEYFMKEWHSFREVMCSTDYSPEQKQDAWAGLLTAYIHCKDEADRDIRQTAMEMLVVEFPLRLGLELTAKLRDLFGEALVKAGPLVPDDFLEDDPRCAV